jgi:hypothetical protein
MENARRISNGPHLLAYDNINLSTSIFVEQRGDDTPARVSSGCYGVLYELLNGCEEHMKLEPILEALSGRPTLNFFDDILPTEDQAYSISSQLRVAVVKILLKYAAFPTSYDTLPELQYPTRRPIPMNHRTKQYPTRVTRVWLVSLHEGVDWDAASYTSRIGR